MVYHKFNDNFKETTVLKGHERDMERTFNITLLKYKCSTVRRKA
jgi:hypothetical protein